jgi:outer membrane PBP1 activator LpoA protein
MANRSRHSLIGLALASLASCTTSPSTTPIAPASRAIAAESAIERGDFLEARDLFADLVRRSTGAEQSQFQIGLARSDVGLGAAADALNLLDSMARPLPADLEPDFAAVRADALFALGRTAEAVQELVDREIWLDSADAILDNQSRIWNGLSNPLSQTGARTPTGDPIVDGWLALAPLTRLGDDQELFLQALLDWRSQFAGHPAAGGVLAERLAALRGPATALRTIALLLPLDDQLRPQALAINDGFLAAHFATGNAQSTAIRIYDTALRGSTMAYQDAQLDGADFIVGPLLPDEVGAIQAQAGFVPTLALNVAPGEGRAVASFYQFALSSDDETEAIARRVAAAGYSNAVILHASSDSGYRMMNNFRQSFELLGGHVIDAVPYVPGSQNLTATVAQALHTSESDDRYQRLRANLNRAIEFEPRRRADIDMIFLQTDDPSDARLLAPLLKGNDAENIPTYSTRNVYDPTRSGGDPDLDGVIFPDVPLLVDAVGEARVAADMLSEFSSDNANQDIRLFAFGFDAYLLAQALGTGDSVSWPLSGATGELYVGEAGRIRRALPFAEFTGGRPRAIVTTAETPNR